MPIILSKGYKLPQNGERGWWQVLIENWTRVNSHKHDGNDSEKILTSNLDKLETTVDSANWVAATDGLHTQRITLPGGVTFPKVAIKVYTMSGANVVEEIQPKITRFSNTQFDIFVNDNSLSLKVIYA